MCYAVIRVEYKRPKEPALLVEAQDASELLEKVTEYTSREGVKKITWYFPHATKELISEWRETKHEKGNEGTVPAGDAFHAPDFVRIGSAPEQEVHSQSLESDGERGAETKVDSEGRQETAV